LTAEVSFGDIVTKFFQRRHFEIVRFPHKLFNALMIVDQTARFYPLFGVRWVTDQVLKVDKLVFGRLLGITAIDGALFHHQGTFPRNGFAELIGGDFDRLRAMHDVSDVDHDRVRLLYHRTNGFSRGSNEDEVSRCKWVPES
jgi:hypothetical protein